MPLRLRAERRAFSRDAARIHTRPNPGSGPTRAQRRRRGWRGDISALIHGPHDRAWLFSGTVNGGGQARINAKRTTRGDFWRTVRIAVSGEAEPYFRESLRLLHPKARITGQHTSMNSFTVDLDVHLPGIPAEAVRAVPAFRSIYEDGNATLHLDHIEYYRSDGSTIQPSTTEGALHVHR